MVVLTAPAKLTVSLHITGVRPDGYHLIDAEMVSVDLADTLTLSEGDGLEIMGVDLVPDDDNLVRRALRLAGLTAHVRVDKRIPPGAGLGGGSSNAAAILRHAGIDDLDLAVRLGADVPFCLVGGRARVRGIGEIVDPLPYERRTFTLLTPPFGCSTAAVYRTWDEMGAPRGEHGNDLEPAALVHEPRLVEWRDRLAEATGLRPRLAGSGSTWFVEGGHPGDGRVVVTTIAG
jgi:4-diphosphocytidyl-2-C-methyl-D-erythritol kinase